MSEELLYVSAPPVGDLLQDAAGENGDRMFNGVAPMAVTSVVAVAREAARTYSTRGFGPTAIARVSCNPLDPISVGRAADMHTLCESMAGSEVPWARLLASFFKNGFPRHADRGTAPTPTSTVERQYRQSFKDLCTAKVVRRAAKSCGERGWVGYFQVPKTADLDRAILNCVRTNAGYKEPFPIALAEIDTLLGLMQMFGPEVVAATADLRHFFYQLSIAKADRRYFSLLVDGEVYEALVLPMGFNWAPWGAQGVATWTVAVAVEAIGWRCVAGGEPREFSPPPYWLVYEGESLVGIVVIWYDNYLVLAPPLETSKKLTKAIDGSVRRFSIEWKRDVDGHQWRRTLGGAAYVA
jgi:hypothetical protein